MSATPRSERPGDSCGTSYVPLRVMPLTLAQANEMVEALHRHHPKERGHRFSIGVVDDHDHPRGAAIVGRQKARAVEQYLVAEVTRLVTDGTKNACSMLYGRVCRIGKQMGYGYCQTYILRSEPGTSLRAAGWKPVAVVDGRSWDTPSRRRTDDHPTEDKVRWECACSPNEAIDIEASDAA